MANNCFSKTSWISAGMTFAVLALNGCSLSSSNGDPSLHLDLSSLQDRSGQYSLLGGGGFLNGLVAPPTAATGFACYGVNVTGPGIMDSSMHVERDPMVVFDQLLNVPDTYCSYRGVVTPPIQLTGTGSTDVALQVPPGGVRLVQLVGVNDSTVCASGTFGGNDTGGSSGKYFEIGRGVVYDLFGDRSIEVTTNWPTTTGVQGDIDRNARTLDCGGHCIDPSGSAESISNFDFISPISLPTPKAAQKITVAESTYLRRVDVALASVSALADVTLTVYTDSSGSPDVSTGYSATVSSVPNAVGMVGFDMYNGGSGYLYLPSGTTYWLVLTANYAVKFPAPGGTPEGVSGDVKYWNGSSWFTNTSSNRIFSKIRACN